MADRSMEDFKTALDGLMRDRYKAGPFTAPTISELVRDLGGAWHYENVRKMLAGERGLPMTFIEDVAQLFGKEPTYFREYRVEQVNYALHKYPEVLSEVYDMVIDLAARLEEKESAGQGKNSVGVFQNAGQRRRREATS